MEQRVGTSSYCPLELTPASLFPPALSFLLSLHSLSCSASSVLHGFSVITSTADFNRVDDGCLPCFFILGCHLCVLILLPLEDCLHPSLPWSSELCHYHCLAEVDHRTMSGHRVVVVISVRNLSCPLSGSSHSKVLAAISPFGWCSELPLFV